MEGEQGFESLIRFCSPIVKTSQSGSKTIQPTSAAPQAPGATVLLREPHKQLGAEKDFSRRLGSELPIHRRIFFSLLLDRLFASLLSETVKAARTPGRTCKNAPCCMRSAEISCSAAC
mmetsp:Transcript_15074/g.49107  ORF Transcript_15074/g.49107 Transcript_15074/m.49107 type:complete len:118 (+) Transcript_15074:663-1016(+)